MTNTRMTTDKTDESKSKLTKKGTLEIMREIYQREGISAFFKGCIANLILVINPVINFVIYEFLKKFALKRYG